MDVTLLTGGALSESSTLENPECCAAFLGNEVVNQYRVNIRGEIQMSVVEQRKRERHLLRLLN